MEVNLRRTCRRLADQTRRSSKGDPGASQWNSTSTRAAHVDSPESGTASSLAFSAPASAESHDESLPTTAAQQAVGHHLCRRAGWIGGFSCGPAAVPRHRACFRRAAVFRCHRGHHWRLDRVGAVRFVNQRERTRSRPRGDRSDGDSDTGIVPRVPARGHGGGCVPDRIRIAACGAHANYVPNAVIKGMLAAIGVVIILKQIPHALAG